MKLLGIIGKPLGKTLGPKMFNTLFQKWDTPWRYLPFQVEAEHLKNLLLCMKLSDLQGLNVTHPYKEKVLPFLDSLEASARQSGAVNLIVRKKNKFIGINTDGQGFLKALRTQKKFSPKSKTIVIIGAGGAARGIAAALAGAGAKEICFFNRDLARARKAAKHLHRYFPKTLWKFLPLNTKNYQTIFANATLLVQTTPVFVKLPLQSLPKKALVCDIVYNPVQTKFLTQAKKQKLETMDGLWMLFHQAALNCKLWTGKTVDPVWWRGVFVTKRGCI
ncbi:MAG: shikimate dehydrogenase [Deltaproteobacteria bacterium]|nr:shikimate dehydrogenase [Deltaproteobacteria bacterium]